MAVANAPTEAQRRLAVRAKTRRLHRDDIKLLNDLLIGAYHQMERVDDTSINNDGRRFQLMVLSQSLNAGFSAFLLLTDGYPRMALHFARFLREGNIAFRWSSAEDSHTAVLHHFENYRRGRHYPRGTWPSVGDMARSLPETFLESKHYQGFHAWERKIANELLSHAVSDWSLDMVAGRTDHDSWHPAVGPGYNEGALEQALDVLLPLYLWLLVDCAEYAAAITDLADHERVQPLIDRFSAWKQQRSDGSEGDRSVLLETLGFPFRAVG